MKHAPVHRRAPRQVASRLFAAAFLVVGATGTAPAQEPRESEELAVVAGKEYFVRQQPGEVIVVRVDAFEAAFSSTLTSDDGEVAVRSGLKEARMMPIYQFVPEAATPRQIDIRVSATQVTDRTEFELVTTRLNVRDERSANLATAYRLLAAGLEVVPSGNMPAWTVKIQTLMQAGRSFEDLGMRELGLWCSAYASHLILHELRDPQTGRDWAEEILAVPRIERYEEIFFAARKIRSSAMAAGAAAAANDPLNSPLQAALAETAQSAGTLGYRYEEALAFEAAGVDLKKHGLNEAALGRLDTALGIAVEIGASDLATAIREHLVEIHGEAGDSEASGSVLQDIESQLMEAGEDEELARNLLQQGRLYIESYRYADAVEVLTRASTLEQSSLTRLQSELELGRALNEAGRSREALVHLEGAATHPDSGKFRQPSTVLHLFSALGDIADIHRQLGQYAQMSEVRAVQGEHARSEAERANWAYTRGTDALFQYGADASETRARFENAFRATGDDATRAWNTLAQLRLCAALASSHNDDQRCTANATRAAFETARAVDLPRRQAEARLAYAQLLSVKGRTGRALEIAENQISVLSHSGTAVLGAWYWQRRAALFDNYINLMIRKERDTGAKDGFASLLALARARALDRGLDGRAPLVNEEILHAFLGDLTPETVVLAYYLGDRSGHVWLAGRDRVRRIEISDAEGIARLCRGARSAIEAGAWNDFGDFARRLGDALLVPVSGGLVQSLYVVSQGVLSGIPVDALTLEGVPLGARHRVLHLDQFPPMAGNTGGLRMQPPDRIFLAGNPQDWSGEYSTRIEPSIELDSVTERFVGPGLNTVQGVALLVDEFADGRYADSDLAHLAVPGVVELSSPRESRLVLSEAARGEGRQMLDSADLRMLPTHARLVFFSRTEFSGTGAVLDNRLGVVSAVLEAGAGAAIATLWPVDDEARNRIVSGFYDHLLTDGNAAIALARVKRDSMQAGDAFDWASFQLFLN